jgi:peptidyl-prolyl cis-trans isomerase SurA
LAFEAVSVFGRYHLFHGVHRCSSRPGTLRLDLAERVSYSAAVKISARSILIWAVFLSFATVLARAANPDLVNGVAAIVGDAVITYKDVQMAIEDDLQFLEQHYRSQQKVLAEKAAQLEKDKLQELIEHQLVLQEFKRAQYILPESYLQSRINEDIRQYGDRLTLTKTLQAKGLTFESYRTKLREKIILELMWREKVPPDPLISPAKMEAYYKDNVDKFKVEDQVKLRMIVLTNRPNEAAFSPLKMAQEITAKLDEGVPFEELARIYSQDTQRLEGGDRGWMQKTALREDLSKVAFGLKPGEHSQPIETPGGVYIILVEETRVSYTKSLAEARDEVEATLKAEETRRLRKKWIEQLKSKAFIRYF